MIIIPLTKGHTALLSDEDEDLAWFSWYAFQPLRAPWYAARRDRNRQFRLLHHEVWARAHPGEPMLKKIDHANGHGLDCRRENLRSADDRSNARNAGLRRDSTSGFKGVYWNRQKRRWHARIAHRHVGFYTDLVDAARAYDAAARQQFGEFAALNFPTHGERAA